MPISSRSLEKQHLTHVFGMRFPCVLILLQLWSTPTRFLSVLNNTTLGKTQNSS